MSSQLNRRKFIEMTAQGAAAASVASAVNSVNANEAKEAKVFRLWTMGCSHVGTDLRVAKRESLADAIRHSEQGSEKGGPAFDWDIALHLGDSSGNQGSPTESEGREIIRQFNVGQKHGREHFYNIAGNHDASGPGEPSMQWFQKWIDPLGEHTEFSGVDATKRPYKTEGTWERYSFSVGNLLFLMMSDRNDGGPPVGRDTRGGYPSGAVTGETFRWWKQTVEEHPESLIISTHHHMLKETTVASGPWEGFTKRADGNYKSYYHGYFPKGGPEGASYLYWVDGKADAQAFERYLAAHPGAIDLWLGGHTHTNPDDDKGDRTHIERKWKVNFVNVSALSKYHGSLNVPMSRLLTFTEGSENVRVQCYLHTSHFAAEGWYAKAERTIQLSKPFQFG